MDDYRRNDLPALERLARRHGDVIYIDLVGIKAFLFNHPDLIHHVLIEKRDNYLKMPGAKIVRRFFGSAMQLDNGDYARRMRRVMAPMFQPDRLAQAYTDVIVQATHSAMDAWQSGPRPGLAQELMELALDVAVQIHFGSKPGQDTRQLSRVLVAAMSQLGNFMLPEWIPTARNRRYQEAVATLDAEVMRRIHASRQDRAERVDLLSTFLRLEDESGQTMTDRQARDEIVTMISAGYQSVGMALGQTLRLVAEHPRVDERLAQELSAVLDGRSPAATDLARLTYTEKVLKEALRYCPPAGVIARRAVAEDEVAGWTVPAGARVFLSAWVMHRDGRFYANPLSFEPERWTQDFERSLPMCAYFPFGRGPRGCIAGTLASLIVQLMLATIMQRYRLETLHVTPAHQSTWPVILRNGGLEVVIHPRPPAHARATV